MTSFGKIDALAPFDENEEPDSEPDDDDEEEDEEREEKDDGGETDDLSLQIKGMGLSKDSPLLKDSLTTNGQHTTEVRNFVKNLFTFSYPWNSI